MHLSVHFNRAHRVVVRCEASGASEATPAVAEASGSYLYIFITGQPWKFNRYTTGSKAALVYSNS